MIDAQVIRGKAHKFGNDINTDLISPARYMELDNDEIAAHAMEGADPEFVGRVSPGDILVAGDNFGSGSSRETAPIALKGCGIGAVIATFFARIFYRNCINIGLPVMICQEADQIGDGDELEVDPLRGVIRDKTTGRTFHCKPLPANIMELIAHGGLLGDLEARIKKECD